MSSQAIGTILVLAALGGGGYFGYRAWFAGEEQPVTPTPRVETPAPETPKFQPRVVKSAFAVDEKQVPREDRFELPDGSWALALNGVKNAGKLEWPRDRPYAPIVERVLQKDGIERYKHADGSFSWTQSQYRNDLGRMDSVTVLANPTQALPMLPDEIEANTRR